ncbi:MAG: nucleotidyltransferase domain-containing protein [Chloroflexota bacterium]
MYKVKTKMRPTGFPPVAETLPQAVKKIAHGLDPEKIILFGSYAYGDPTPDSDVDLLVVLDTEQPRKERVVAVSLLLYPRPFPVDILVKTPKEVREELNKGNFFTREIMEKGKVLYERSK